MRVGSGVGSGLDASRRDSPCEVQGDFPARHIRGGKFGCGVNAPVLKIIGDPPPGHHPGMVSAAALLAASACRHRAAGFRLLVANS
jgi:hypothetical protein